MIKCIKMANLHGLTEKAIKASIMKIKNKAKEYLTMEMDPITKGIGGKADSMGKGNLNPQMEEYIKVDISMDSLNHEIVTINLL